MISWLCWYNYRFWQTPRHTSKCIMLSLVTIVPLPSCFLQTVRINVMLVWICHWLHRVNLRRKSKNKIYHETIWHIFSVSCPFSVKDLQFSPLAFLFHLNVEMIFAFNKIFTVIFNFILNNTLQVEKFGIFKFFFKASNADQGFIWSK